MLAHRFKMRLVTVIGLNTGLASRIVVGCMVMSLNRGLTLYLKGLFCDIGNVQVQDTGE